MKKIAFMFAVAAAFAACAGNGNKPAEEVAADSVEAVEEVVDTVAADTVAADTVAADSAVAQ